MILPGDSVGTAWRWARRSRSDGRPPPSSMAHAPASKDTASLADFLHTLRLRVGLIVLILALVVVTAVAVTAFLPRWYLATTKVRVEKPEGEVKLFQAQSSTGFDPYFLQD